MREPVVAPPEEFVRRVRAGRYPIAQAEVDAFLRAALSPPPIALRLNPAKPALLPFGTEAVPWCALGRIVTGDGARPGLSPLHAAGAYYIQDPSAMAAAEALGARPGEVILDLCAAPGGKATAIAGSLAGEGWLIANEIVPARARILLENLERWGTVNATVLCETPQRIAEHFGPAFDRVLVDAPCSGESLFGKDPQSRAEWSPGNVTRCAARQKEILRHAEACLKTGGVLVYATCTFNAEENEDVVAWAIEALGLTPDDSLALSGSIPCGPGMIRYLPHRSPGAGHFIARMIKRKDADIAIPEPHQRAKEEPFHSGWSEAAAEWLRAPPLFPRAVQSGEWLHAPMPFSLEGLRVPRPTVQLARAIRERLEPAHHLAMALRPEDALLHADLGEREALAYLAGEALCYEGPRGYTLCCFENLPLGWGKAADGRLRNLRPKGLRVR